MQIWTFNNTKTLINLPKVYMYIEVNQKCVNGHML